MKSMETDWTRRAVLLAITLLYLMVWGFAGIDKLRSGMPAWFPDKFGGTFLAKIPGLTMTFWILALSEIAVFLLAAMALVRCEFLRDRTPAVLEGCLVGSLFVFLQLGFGQWLTSEYNGTFQQFVYFAGTLVALIVVRSIGTPARFRAAAEPAGGSR